MHAMCSTMVDAESEQFSLRWNNFHSNLTAGFHALLEGEDLVDVTLAAGGQFVQAHKIVLSVCSPYFKELFKVNPCKHPIVILKDVGHKELVAILHFMYQGEVNVRQDDLATFLKIAEMLQIKGLTGDDSSATNTQQPSVPKSRERTPPPPPQLPLRRERTPPPPPVRREITPPLRQSSALTSIIEPLPVQSEETTVRPFKRMRAEATIVPVPPPPAPMQTPTSSLKVTSPCTVNEDTSGVEFVEITKPKDEPVDYESDIEEVDNKIEPVREDPLVQLLGGESSSQSHQDSSQGATPPIFASIPGLSQDSGGTPEGGQGWHPASCSPFGMTTCMKCPLCARVFVNKFNLKVHIRDVHSLDSGPFSCSQCGKQVKNRSCLRVHIYQQHRKKPSDSILKSKEEISDDSKD